jgi:hypothetical protein
MRAYYCALAAASLAACSDPADYALGRRGEVEFAIQPLYERPVGDECFISCRLDRPLLAGTSEMMMISGHTAPLPWLDAVSSNPSVLGVEVTLQTCCDNGCTDGDTYDECLGHGGRASFNYKIQLDAIDDGRADLVLATTDHADAVYDELPIEVRRPASLELQVQADASANYQFSTASALDLTGNHASVRVIARDRDGDALFASTGITMSLGGSVAEFFGMRPDWNNAYGVIWPMARGNDTLVAASGDVSATFAVTSR